MPKIELCPCESSRIAAHGYDMDTNTLWLQFRKKGGAPGPTYTYAKFPPEKYEELKRAESKGSFFVTDVNVKDEDGNLLYPFTRLPEEPKED